MTAPLCPLMSLSSAWHPVVIRDTCFLDCEKVFGIFIYSGKIGFEQEGTSYGSCLYINGNIKQINFFQ